MRATRRAGLALGLLLSLTGLACVPGALPGKPQFTGAYHIAPPDVLLITVRPEPEIARQVTVRPDGRISFDLIGDVEVRGRTIQQIRAEMTKRLEEFIVQPEVSVSLAQSNSRVYFVFGEVRRPGKYPIVGDVTALHALASAGGPTRFAMLSSSRLVRPAPEGNHAWKINFNDIALKGRNDTDYPLEPGDVIYVPPNASAQIGYAMQVIFFPFQQILGLGGRFVGAAVGG